MTGTTCEKSRRFPRDLARPSYAVIDAQLHEPGPRLSWPERQALRHALFTEMTFAAMHAAGVEAAVLHPMDHEWGTVACGQFPTTFAWVASLALQSSPGAISVSDHDIAGKMSQLSEEPGLAAVRILPGLTKLGSSGFIALREGAYDRALTAADELRLPVFVYATGDLKSVLVLARRFPRVRFVVDHVGLPQPPMSRPDSPPWAALDVLLELAVHVNVFVKLSGLPSLSREPYPHADVIPVVERLLGEFGAQRLMWGSDITRITGRIGFEWRLADGPYAGKHTYAEAVRFLGDLGVLREDEARWVFGDTVRSLLGRPLVAESTTAPQTG